MTNYTEATNEHISSLNLEDRKALGQYMTPQFIGQNMASLFTVKPGETYQVLDPAVGTGELLLAFKNIHPNIDAQFSGWDVDKGMLKVLKNNIPESSGLCQSMFDKVDSKYLNFFDKIIGNPPYFEIKKNDPQLKNITYETASETGRLNIYALFFEYSLKLLKNGGELVFLVPPSMNNGAYFTVLRNFILKNSYIKKIEILRESNHFADAQTSTQIIHLVKNENSYEENLKKSSKYVFDFNQVVKNSPKKLPIIFTAERQILEEAWKKGKSLFELGFQVKTGTTIWNLQKDKFTAKKSNTAPLLYSKDINSENKLELIPKLDAKRWLPTTQKSLHTTESIIVNRIVGGLHDPNLRYAYVQLPAYFTENHVNVITATTGDLKTLTVKLKNSSAWLSSYLKALTGNTQISATELQFLLPF